jgi:hypothetical protein
MEFSDKDRAAHEAIWQRFWAPEVAPTGEVDMALLKSHLYTAYVLQLEFQALYTSITESIFARSLAKAQVEAMLEGLE